MRSAIVSGATGLVGSATAIELATRGIEVLALGRRNLGEVGKRKFLNAGVAYLKLDMGEIHLLPKRILEEGRFTVRDCVFFHFAWSGINRLTDGDLSTQLTNAVATAKLVEVAEEIGCKKVVLAGTMQETHLERFLNGETSRFSSTNQQNYAIAKMAARDMSRIVAYLKRIDLVHTRMSVPLDFSLERGGYVAKTLREILLGHDYSQPESDEIVDVIALDEAAEAYLRIGASDLRAGDFYIGSSRPLRLRDLFSQFEKLVAGRAAEMRIDESAQNLFDNTPLQRLVGFSPSKRIEDLSDDRIGN